MVGDCPIIRKTKLRKEDKILIIAMVIILKVIKIWLPLMLIIPGALLLI